MRVGCIRIMNLCFALRLYCDPPGSKERRSVQLTLWLVIEALNACLAPFFPDLTEEVEAFQKSTSSATSHLERLSRPYRNSQLSVGSMLLQVASKWAIQWEPELNESIAVASHLRQAISALQNPGDSEPLWPCPVSNPLARLHISIAITNSESPIMQHLQVMLPLISVFD